MRNLIKLETRWVAQKYTVATGLGCLKLSDFLEPSTIEVTLNRVGVW